MSNAKFYELIFGVPIDSSEDTMDNFLPFVIPFLRIAKSRMDEEKGKHRREFCAVLREIGQKKAKMELLNVLNERKKFLQEIKAREEYEEILFRVD